MSIGRWTSVLGLDPSDPAGVVVVVCIAAAVLVLGWLALAVLLGSAFQLLVVHSLLIRLVAGLPPQCFFRGIFDVTVAFVTKDEFDLWWLQLVAGLAQILHAFWIAGDFKEKAILLVVYVGIVALMRGITELFLAYKLKGLQRRLRAA